MPSFLVLSFLVLIRTHRLVPGRLVLHALRSLHDQTVHHQSLRLQTAPGARRCRVPVLRLPTHDRRAACGDLPSVHRHLNGDRAQQRRVQRDPRNPPRPAARVVNDDSTPGGRTACSIPTGVPAGSIIGAVDCGKQRACIETGPPRVPPPVRSAEPLLRPEGVRSRTGGGIRTVESVLRSTSGVPSPSGDAPPAGDSTPCVRPASAVADPSSASGAAVSRTGQGPTGATARAPSAVFGAGCGRRRSRSIRGRQVMRPVQHQAESRLVLRIGLHTPGNPFQGRPLAVVGVRCRAGGWREHDWSVRLRWWRHCLHSLLPANPSPNGVRFRHRTSAGSWTRNGTPWRTGTAPHDPSAPPPPAGAARPWPDRGGPARRDEPSA